MLRRIIFAVIGLILLILLLSAIKTFVFPDTKKSTITETQTTPYDTKIVESKSIAPQTTKVSQTGMPGLTRITYEVTIKKGQEISRREVKREVVRESTIEIIAKNSAIVPTSPQATSVPKTGPGESALAATAMLTIVGTYYVKSKKKLVLALARNNKHSH